MFRARKPSVQRASVGKHIAKEPPVIKPEPRAVVDAAKHESTLPPHPPAETAIKPDVPPSTDVTQVNTMPFRPKLTHMPFPNKTSQAVNSDLPRDSLNDDHDADPDLRYLEKKRQYSPCQGEDDDQEDLTRPVRKDRKISPENDPLFAQIFAMFPEDSAAK